MTTLEDLDLRRRVAEEAAQAAGAVHTRLRGSRLARDVHGGNRADYSTEADVQASQAVRDTVASYFPGEPLIGEEDAGGWEAVEGRLHSGCWLTDPLDGTLEFVHGTPAFSAVVSYVSAGQPRACAVFFPAWQELFSAAEGRGATLNGRPISVSSCRELAGAILATPHRGTSPEQTQRFTADMLRLVPHLEAFRIPGPPSQVACAVACGRYDIASFLRPRQEAAPGLPFPGQPWESAAFVLLVREAGGVAQAFGGGPPDLLGQIAYAASETLLEQFFNVMAAGNGSATGDA